MLKKIILATAAFCGATLPAFAHLNPAEHGSFMAGFSHPLFGLDHVLVMVAVGLWASSFKGRTMGIVPLAFVGTMALGFAAAIFGMPFPFVEPVILASVIFIGILVALALPIPATGVAATVAVFALFHGYAHGGELGAAGAWQFAAGFVMATTVLHASGIIIGLTFSKLRAPVFTRIAGGLTALGGLWLAIGA